MRRFYLIFLGIFVIGCSHSSKNKIRLALDWTVNTNHIGILAAQKNGFYKQEGLEVKLIDFGKTGAISLLMANQVEFALSGQGELTFARDTDAPLISIAALLQHNPTGFYSLKKTNIESPKDFQGKIYGGWGSTMEDAIIRALISEDGIVSPQFENRVIGSMNLQSALQNVDFVWGYRGWQGAQLDVQNLDYNFLPVVKYIPVLDDYSPIVVVNGDSSFYKNHQNQIKSFLKATAKGYQWVMQNPLEAEKILLSYDETLDPVMVRRSLQVLLPYIKDENTVWGFQDKSRFQNYIHFLKKKNLIVHDLQAEEMMNNQFLEK